MAWVFLVDGRSIKFTAGEMCAHELRATIKNHEVFKALSTHSAGLGLALEVCVDDERDPSELVIMVGYELLKSRHIYCGQTHSCERHKNVDEGLMEECASKIKSVLLGLGISEFTEVRGVILNQFD